METTSSTPSSPSSQPNNDAPLAAAGDLLGTFRRRFDYTYVPQLGKRFRHRNLNELERSRYENSLLNAKGRLRGDRLLQLKVRLLAITLVDEQGNLLYAEKHLPQLMQQDSQVIDILLSGVKKHCGISDDDLEDMEKNFGATADAA